MLYMQINFTSNMPLENANLNFPCNGYGRVTLISMKSIAVAIVYQATLRSHVVAMTRSTLTQNKTACQSKIKRCHFIYASQLYFQHATRDCQSKSSLQSSCPCDINIYETIAVATHNLAIILGQWWSTWYGCHHRPKTTLSIHNYRCHFIYASQLYFQHATRDCQSKSSQQ